MLEEDAFNADSYAPSDANAFSEMDDVARKEFWSTLALRHCPGIGARTRGRLLKYFGSAFTAIHNAGSWHKLGIKSSCISEIKSDSWRNAAKKEWDAARQLNLRILLWNNGAYPRLLREIVDPPALLYYKGDLQLFRSPAIAVIGSRQARPHSLEVAAYFAGSLASCGITVISGMALGIDSRAHAAALQRIGKSIGVLGTGINVTYPASNEDLFYKMDDKGLLVSEFAPFTAPISANFPIRNRIISGLSLGVVVIEAAERSGSLITARCALEQNREVFAVPGEALNHHSMGCQNLVRQGAHPVFCVEDILRDLADTLRAFELKPPEPPALLQTDNAMELMPYKIVKTGSGKPESPKIRNCASPVPAYLEVEPAQKLVENDDASRILNYLRGAGPVNIDVLAQSLQISPDSLAVALTGMEMLGQVKRLPGARIEVC